MAGAVLGFGLSLVSTLGASRSKHVAAFVGRLVVFAVAVGFVARAYGPLPGLLVLIAAVLTRAIAARRSLAAAAKR